ncbi:MAG: UDP-N-acetylmuramoyl-tripeptide--D-alanyl-D-alanine ligase [Anaerolineae bacterium]|nr:UDP-N-acetylmuramoyl-tripeptide--D-alanyl-D-alanine ligase [Anaerolineae bacterium]
MLLSDLYAGLTGNKPSSSESVAAVLGERITRVAIDSRQVIPGSVFFALQGEALDGHQFIGEALARGAIAIVGNARALELGFGRSLTLIDVAGLQPNPNSGVTPDLRQGAGDSSSGPALLFVTENSLRALQQFATYWRGKFPDVQVIGVTGSVGKTSTKELIWAVLKQRYRTLKSQGNLNSETGLALAIFELNETHERAVLEMGMYAAGEIATLCEIAKPIIGVITLVAPIHLERLGTIENIANAKAELAQALPAEGWAILNGDDPRVLAMREQTRARVMTFGIGPTNDLWADEIESRGLEGMEFALHYRDAHLHVRVPLLGQHSVHTALAAAAVGLVQDLSWEEILHGLTDVSAQLRLIAVPGKNGITILDDTYNASPPSTLSALNLLLEMSGRKIAVLGDMRELGAFEQEGHQLVGIRAAEVADIIIAVGPLGTLIGQAAQQQGHAKVYYAQGNEQATAEITRLAQQGDIVLIKGSRGAQMEEIVQALTLETNAHGGAPQ